MHDEVMVTPTNWKLDELASEAGVSARTVRYYVQRGLLPAPTFRGKDSSYERVHLVRLRAIKRLHERFLPLDAIQAELDRRTVDEIERIAAGKDADLPAIAPVPAAPGFPGPAPETWTTYTLAPGLVLNVSGHASPHARALADRLLAWLRAHEN